MVNFFKRFFIFIILFLSFSVYVNAEEENNNMNAVETDTQIINNSNIEENGNDLITTQEIEEKDEENIEIQYTKVLISKLNEDGQHIKNAKLQILDMNNNIIKEWISDGNVYEIMLPAGKYILHEVLAPEGYELANDKMFEVESVIADEIIGDVDWSEYPCNHKNGNQTPLYYVSINSVSYEVYCINQGLETPDGIKYNGKIVDPEEIRNFTKQETNIDAEGFTISGSRINVNTQTISDFDVSDQTLTNQELYDKILDIIYRRNLAEKDEKFSDLSIVEIRFITEFALKNYLNARITTYETFRELSGTTVKHLRYNENGEIWQEGDGTKYLKLYNKFYNREYVYDVNSPTGYIINSGNGDSFGNLAKHWYENHGKEKIPAKFAKLYYYLINGEDTHPEEMKLYMYSPTVTKEDGSPYQYLLGITGFVEDANIKNKAVEMIDKYSDEKRNITVEKEWDDVEGFNESRPKSVTINLFADDELYKTAELSEENGWFYEFNDLKVYNNGKKIIYTITEEEVPNYFTEITGNMEDGFTIINTSYGEGGDEPPEPEIENPQTGDNINNYVFMLVTSLLGITISYIGLKSSKSKTIIKLN